MTYGFKASELSKLYGQTFQFKAQDGMHAFAIQPKDVYSARAGLEAYGVQVLHTPPQRRPLVSFLKIFRQDIPERKNRTAFLIKLELAKGHWAFQGVPYALFPGTEINGIKIVGHLTRFLGHEYGGSAHDFAELKEKWDVYSPGERRAFACHLASAIEALERSGIVHGDLSPNNIMIGPGPSGRSILCLCDFDGFNHTKVLKLPRLFDGQPVRPLGSPGYQYADLAARVLADTANTDDRIYVDTDRFALAALIVELMVWDNKMNEKLGRGELLTEQMIAGRSLAGLPSGILKPFPEGGPLLEKALQATSIGALPSPKEWLGVLGVKSVVQAPFSSAPKASFRRRGESVPPRQALLNSKPSGDFGAVHASLAEVAFTRSDDHKLRLQFKGALPAIVVRGGSTTKIEGGERQAFEIFPDDTVKIGDWEITFENSAALSI